MSASSLARIEVVADRSAASRCDEGFLRVRRLLLRNEYADGSRSREYPCDVVSRRREDAVVALLYEIDGERRVRVLLRRATRAPVWLRRAKALVRPDARAHDTLLEVVAGLLEEEDGPSDAGLARRAAVEAHEEAGLELPQSSFRVLGDGAFASPGTTDEKLYYAAASGPLARAHAGHGDGSVMEEGAEVIVLSLREAIAACRRGEIADLKTEVGLWRLADHVGYLPQLDRFADELPRELAARHDRLGVPAARA